jgi:hypothetical protein
VTDVPIACTLDPSALGSRVAEWRALVGTATSRVAIDGGVELELPPTTDVRAVADLVARELECCAFFEFSISLAHNRIALAVHGPQAAESLISELLGSSPATPKAGCCGG